MSQYQVLGIDHEGKLHSLTSDDSKERVLAYALEAVTRFRQLFLLRNGYNVRELNFVPPSPPPPPPEKGTLEEGAYSPLVLER